MEEIIQGVKKMKVKELKAELKARGITLNANKGVLAARLIKEVKRDELERTHGDDVNDVDDVKDGDEQKDDVDFDETEYHDADNISETEDEVVNDVAAAIPTKSSVFTFKDVEESLQRFSGDRKQNLQKWITDFEETATVLKWTDIHKLIYGKRLLTGAAKMFINVEKSVTSYKQLITCLKDEFGQSLSSVKIHKQLMATKKQQAETYREYLYRMMAIAEQANIDIESTIQYVIDGIDDSEANKSVLYGVTKLSEIKKRLDAYEIMKSKSTDSLSDSSKSEKFSSWHNKNDAKKDKNDLKGDTSSESENRRCYRCGGSGHGIKKCTNELKCFKCNQSGHISKDCLHTEAEKSKNDYTSEADAC